MKGKGGGGGENEKRESALPEVSSLIVLQPSNVNSTSTRVLF